MDNFRCDLPQGGVFARTDFHPACVVVPCVVRARAVFRRIWPQYGIPNISGLVAVEMCDGHHGHHLIDGEYPGFVSVCLFGFVC
jgi:hypothetical protein